MELDFTRLLSTHEVARRLDLSTDYVRRVIRSGRIPSTPTSLGRLVRPQDVDAFARRRQLVTAGDAGGAVA
jgi:excisionase family DNA binding protein